jgi:RNA polymerase sigma factor (sigma-70 family)
MLGSLVGEPVEAGAAPRLDRVDRADHAAMRADAFRDLLDRRLDAAYGLAAVILGDRVEAEDAVHDAAVVAWRRWDELRDPERFEAWFRCILVNGCRDRLRTRARHRVVDLGRDLREAEHPLADDATARTADRDLLEDAFRSLGPDELLVVVLRFHLDLTVPAIAAAIRAPEGTVKSRLHNALARLRRALEEADA